MSETQFVCELCHQHYSTFEILMTHNRLRHYHTIKFGCGYCNETFRNEDDLYCHFVLTHHIDPYGQPALGDRARRRSRSNSEASEENDDEHAVGKLRLVSESDDGSVGSADVASSAEGEYDDDDNDDDEHSDGSSESDAELNYNELYMRRKRSAMTQEEISELTDVFKKTVEATYTSKFRF